MCRNTMGSYTGVRMLCPGSGFNLRSPVIGLAEPSRDVVALTGISRAQLCPRGLSLLSA